MDKIIIKAIITAVLVVFKVTEVITWSWLIVFIPIWGPIVRDIVGLWSIWLVRRWRNE